MRALEPAERALESAGRPFEASWEARSDLGGPAGNSRGGHRERETDTEWSVPGMWWYNIGHHPLRGRCPKRRRRTSIMIMKINGSSAGLEWAAEIWQIMVSFGANQYSSFRSLSVSVCLSLYIPLSCACVRTRTRAYGHARVPTDTHACVRTRTRAYGHARVCTDTHSRVR